MELIFKFSGRGMQQETAWDAVMLVVPELGFNSDIEMNLMLNSGMRLYFRTRSLDNEELPVMRSKLIDLAEALLQLSEGGNAKLFKSDGEQVFSYTKHDEHLYAIA